MLRYLLTLFALIFSSQSFAFGLSSPFNSGASEFLPVEQAFILSIQRDESGQAFAKWDIADGYYLYKHQLKITQESGPTVRFGEVPAGEIKEDPYFGTVEVFHEELVIPLIADDLSSNTVIDFNIGFQGCAERGLCYPPQLAPMSSEFSSQTPISASSNSTTNVEQSGAQRVTQLIADANLLKTIIVMIGLGLLLAFTPCVLPMVPIVSAIVVGSKVRGGLGFIYSLIYVLGMASTYAMIGALAGWFGTRLNLQAALQDPIILIGSALIFVLLSLAMFGVFELRLPASLQTKLDHLSNRSQKSRSKLLSIFIAGILATLVVSPCVSAPLAGVVLYISSNSDPLYGALALFSMGLGMGIPLLIVGTLGSTVLPKNGPWLEDIKKLMGFGMLGMAIWLATRWLPSETHLVLWGLCALGVASYFLHRVMSGNSHPVRWFIALLAILIGILELFGAALGATNPATPLKGFYSDATLSRPAESVPYFAKIKSVEELDTVLEQSSKPVVVDLYADWCISCKVTEEEIFKAQDVMPLLKQVALVQVDVTENNATSRSFLTKFNLYGPPSMLFFDQKKQQIMPLQLIGEPTKQEVIDRLNAVLLR